MTTKKRVKIDRKVREHKRKMRKNERHGGHRNPKMVVPRLAPFKDDMMSAIEQLKKQKFAETAERKIEKAKTRNANAKIKRLEDNFNAGEKRQIHGFEKELSQVIEASDVLLEVVDARDPENRPLGFSLGVREPLILSNLDIGLKIYPTNVCN
ncbi:hypothetical protein ACOME3_007500 [Neoechinorhynchus agilis]